MVNTIIGLIAGLGAAFIIFFFYKRLFEQHSQSHFGDLSRKTFQEMMPQLLEYAKKELTGVREEINRDVEKEKRLIKESLEQLEMGIKERQEELKKLTSEGTRQFGSIAESIKHHREIAERLSEKTDNLNKILSTNKLRGDWGEQTAERIMTYAGFIEKVHYIKQAAGTSGTIPDFTLLLPDNRKVNIDAKFPFANLQKFQEAEQEETKQEYLRKFSQDVKQKIREVSTRDYINDEENTLDYVILFVPSEVVYGFIHDRLSEVVDEAFHKKVLITSPTSFYATLRIIMESYRHFMYENNIKEVLKIVQGFIDNFGRFEAEFGLFDEQIEKLRTAYDQIAETRYKMMHAQIKKIEKLDQFNDIKTPLIEDGE